ncbi:MAG: glycosyltransferase [Xanthomonadales bacterium]|nr:glycosyltransferase [Xanthomonadales bacterium]
MDICLHTIWDIQHDFIGGTERFLVELSKELNLLGHNSFIVCTGDNTKKEIQGVPVYGFIPCDYKKSYSKYGEAKLSYLRENFVQGKSYIEGLKSLAKYTQNQVSQIPHDVIHLNSFPSSVFFSSTAPVVVTNHENEAESDSLWGKGFFDELVSLTNSNSSTFRDHFAHVVPSQYYADNYSERFRTNILGINQGVNLSTFRPYKKTSGQYKCEPINLLLPSRVDPHQKGHDIAVRACKILLDQGIDFKLTLTGVRNDNKASVKEVSKMAREIGVADKVVFQSYADINTAYKEADIVISPERYCSYGLSISEALSLGIPTVLSAIPTYIEIAKSYKHAHFFSTGSSENLAQTIIEILPTLKSKSNYSEQIRFRKKYDFRECAKKYSEIYLRAVS